MRLLRRPASGGDWQVTHLVVRPHRHHRTSHLVPVSSVTSCDESLALDLTERQIDDAPLFEVTEFTKVDRPDLFDDDWTSKVTPVTVWPYYPYIGSMSGAGATGFMSGYSSEYPAWPRYVATTIENIPENEIAIHRSSHVVSSDDHRVGKVDGFAFDDQENITQLVLDHGHLWRHREVTIPIGHVRRANHDEVHLDVASDAVGDFPSVGFHRHALTVG